MDINSTINIDLCDNRESSNKNIPIIHVDGIDEIVILHIPAGLMEKYPCVASISEISDMRISINIDAIRTIGTCICIPKFSLNCEIGVHNYNVLLSCVDNSSVRLYFSYRVQNTKAERPYLYMHREEEK